MPPQTPLVLTEDPRHFELPAGKRCGLLARNTPAPGVAGRFAKVEVLPPSRGDLDGAANRLYHLLRALDAAGLHLIVAQSVPETGIGIAIQERLRRAAAATRRP